MSNNEQPKYVQWKSMPLEDFFKKLPKPTLRMRIYRFFLRIKTKRDLNSGRTIHKERFDGVTSHNQSQGSTPETFRESQHFDPEKAYLQRKQEEAYLKSAGFTRDNLILTEKEEMQRKQEDAYFDSIPGYRKTDNERDDR